MTKQSIAPADGGPLFLAGLPTSHTHEGERAKSDTMVMQETAPGDDMHVFHNRQAVMLNRDGAATRLDTARTIPGS